MKRRTEINIELTRTVLIRRPTASCLCAACNARSEMVTAEEAAVMADASTCLISQRIEAEQTPFVENADSAEAIEIESAEGQLILAAAVRSLEQRLSAEARAALSVSPAPAAARRVRFSSSLYAKLCWLGHAIIHPKSAHRTR